MRVLKAVLACVLVVLAGMAGWALFKRAVLPDPNVPLTARQVAPGAYVIQGGVCNMGFVVGRTGVIAIDTQLQPETARNALALIERTAHKPVKAVILTHSDPDHVNGLVSFPPDATIYAQTNVRREILEALDDWMPSPSEPTRALRAHLPTKLVGASADFRLDGVHFILRHVAPAHTDGDLAVYLPDVNVVFAGDILTPKVGQDPGIHLNKNGSSLGWIQFATAVLALHAKAYVAGHGGVLTAADLDHLIRISVAKRAKIVSLFDRSMSLKQAKAALHDKPRPGRASRFPTFVETTYKELSQSRR